VGNLDAAPELVDPDHGDYHLRDTSPAIDKASASVTDLTDLDGEPRPRGVARDIGADEAGRPNELPANGSRDLAGAGAAICVP